MEMVANIVRRYREQQEMTQDQFGTAVGVTKAAVSYWESGQRKPNYEFLLTLHDRNYGWQKDFAADCLAAMLPGMFKPEGKIGQTVLGAL